MPFWMVRVRAASADDGTVPGVPVVYLADHPALAALEVRVHLDLPFELLPTDYVLMRVDVPDAA